MANISQIKILLFGRIAFYVSISHISLMKTIDEIINVLWCHKVSPGRQRSQQVTALAYVRCR